MKGAGGREVEPFRARTVSLTPGRWTSVILDDPSPMRFALDPSWERSRRSSDRYVANDHTNLLVAGNRLTARVDAVESSCFGSRSVQAVVPLASSRPSGFPPEGARPPGFLEWRREQCRGLPSTPAQPHHSVERRNQYQRFVSLRCRELIEF